MIRTPSYSFTDILQAPAIALSAKRIILMTTALLAAWSIYLVSTYASLMISGDSFSSIARSWGCFPFLIPHGAFATLVWGFGVAGAVLILMAGFCGVTAFCIEEVRGNRFMTLSEGFHFARRRLRQLLVAESAIAAFVVFVMLLISLSGIVARIPYIGESLYALIMLFPGFIVAIFLTFILVVWAISIVLLPVVTAADNRRESFMSILETFSTLIRQPLRWVLATAICGVFAKIGMWLFLGVALAALRLLVWGGSLLGGNGVSDIFRSATGKLPLYTEGGSFLIVLFPFLRNIHWGSLLMRPSSGEQFSAYLMAAILCIILAVVVSYGLCIIVAGQTRVYVLIKFLKDGTRLSDEPSLFANDVNRRDTSAESGS